jgi:hypothetical protein
MALHKKHLTLQTASSQALRDVFGPSSDVAAEMHAHDVSLFMTER